MNRFPESVCAAMRRSGATATCVAVQVDQPSAPPLGEHRPAASPSPPSQGWETAAFILAAGPESKADRRVFRNQPQAVPLALETDLIAHDNAAIVVIRLIAKTVEDDPMIGEVLLTPGEGGGHFHALQLLTMQPRLIWFFGDRAFNVIRTQQMPFQQQHHAHFESLLDEATSHDAMVRVTSRYDAASAIREVTEHYEMRSATERSEYLVNRGKTRETAS